MTLFLGNREYLQSKKLNKLSLVNSYSETPLTKTDREKKQLIQSFYLPSDFNRTNYCTLISIVGEYFMSIHCHEDLTFDHSQSFSSLSISINQT